MTTNKNDQEHPLQEERKNKKKWASWFLAVFLLLCLTWVCLFTAVATHTDFAREKIYPKLSRGFSSSNSHSHGPDKEGARLFVYLGCFYLIPGTVTLACFWKGVGLPTFPMWMFHHVSLSFPCSRRHCYMTKLEALLLALFLVVQACTTVTRIVKRFEVEYWATERIWYEVSKTLGKVAALTMTVLFLPVSKSCFWWDHKLLNWQFERVVHWHRFLAWFLVAIVLVHGLTAVVALLIAGQFQNCMWPSSSCQKPGGWKTWKGEETSRIYTYGWMALLVATPLAITSIPWFRRHKFEWFYYTHFLFIPFMVLIHMHYNAMIYYAAPGMAAYLLDKLLWFCCSRIPSKIVSLTQPAPGFVRLMIASHQSFEPGQWVQIQVPAVSKWEWHPMSVASAPGHSTLCIDIKVVGDWTRDLAWLAPNFESRNPDQAKVIVDRFYGSSHSQSQGYLTHSAILLFAGGIGITPIMSTLRALLEDNGSKQDYKNAIQRIDLVWVVKKMSTIELYRKELTQWQSQRETSWGCEVNVIVHATLSEKEEEEAGVANRSILKEPLTTTKRASYTKCLKGYGHMAILTAFAGGGYALGIYLANKIGSEKEWRAEGLSVFQLFVATAAVISLFPLGIGANIFFAAPERTDNEHDKTEVSNVNQEVASMESQGELEVVKGCRPDIQAIVHAMTTYCEKNGLASVGVYVCGPEQLVQSVIETCRPSSGPVDFVVEDESFDW